MEISEFFFGKHGKLSHRKNLAPKFSLILSKGVLAYGWDMATIGSFLTSQMGLGDLTMLKEGK